MKTRIWIGVGVCVLVAVARQRLQVPHAMYEMPQVPSLTLFESEALRDVLLGSAPEREGTGGSGQLLQFGA